jgi:hypothetical protein
VPSQKKKRVAKRTEKAEAIRVKKIALSNLQCDPQNARAHSERNLSLIEKSIRDDRYGRGRQSIAWLRANVDPKARRIRTPVKHHYVYPLDAALRARLIKIAKPYPKKCAASETIDTPADQVGEGGEAPTAALQESRPARRKRSA